MDADNLAEKIEAAVRKASRLAIAWQIIGEEHGQGALITFDGATISVGLSPEVPVGTTETRTINSGAY